MPNCFQLTKKGETEPSSFETIDRAICEYLGIEVSEKYYALGWYNSIGIMLAYGKTFEEMRTSIFLGYPSDFMKIINFLEANYTVKAWATR